MVRVEVGMNDLWDTRNCIVMWSGEGLLLGGGFEASMCDWTY